ncbi:hypothetical protein HK096_006551, partial [Nowakowskiella sp. JEL0078]
MKYKKQLDLFKSYINCDYQTWLQSRYLRWLSSLSLQARRVALVYGVSVVESVSRMFSSDLHFRYILISAFFSGSTTCCAGSVCTYSNAYYSQVCFIQKVTVKSINEIFFFKQCLVASSSSSTTTTTTTTTKASTTTTTTKASTTTTTTKASTTTTTTSSKAPTTTTTTTSSKAPTTTTTTTTTKASTTTTTASTSSSPIATSAVPSGGPAYAAPTGSYTSSGNPYEGATRYVSGVYAAKVDTSIASFSTNATRVAEFNQLKKYPTYTWLDTISAIGTLQSHLNAASAQSGGSPIVAEFVIYDLPGRDCAALASNGEIPAGGIATYKSQYIDPIVTILSAKPSNVRAVLVIEPD